LPDIHILESREASAVEEKASEARLSLACVLTSVNVELQIRIGEHYLPLDGIQRYQVWSPMKNGREDYLVIIPDFPVRY